VALHPIMLLAKWCQPSERSAATKTNNLKEMHEILVSFLI
jgi:hypothetical protein